MSSDLRLRTRMKARAVDEPHRVSSQLELLFDLTFVIAVSAVTTQFARHVMDGHALTVLVPFFQVFFAIWWAWMNFTWFASSYDTDDVVYRLLTMVQMGGVLVLAAGVPQALNRADYGAVTLGYLIMRMGLVTQWVRAGIEDPGGRRTALRYAAAISLLQVGWVAHLALARAGALPAWAGVGSFLALVGLELAVPRWAERAGPTSWHPHHIAERYGLFTIILLGESVLAASTGVQTALTTMRVSGQLVAVAAAALVLLFALWWLYFLEPAGAGLSRHRRSSYWWGYGHYGLFASLAALGGGLESAVQQTARPEQVSPMVSAYAVAVPTALFLASLWAVHRPLVDTPVLAPAATAVGLVAIGVMPLTAVRLGVTTVVVGIAGVAVALIATTFTRGAESGPIPATPSANRAS